MMKRKAFTLVEILIAMFLMSVVILSIFLLNQSANKSSMDAYYEMLCFSLAREPIEIYRGFGYKTANDIIDNPELAPKQYPVNAGFVKIESNFEENIRYPEEAENFERQITLVHPEGSNYVRIEVRIQPIGTSKADSWMRRNDISLESIIMEQPK